MRINLTEIEQCTEELNKKYNVHATITTQSERLAIFPPYGGTWIVSWFLHINDKEILIGTDYNTGSIEKLKSKIEEIIKEEAL